MDNFLDLQKTLRVPKGRDNEYGGYKYRSCEDILAAIKAADMGFITKAEDEIVLIGDRYYVKATVSLIDTNVISGGQGVYSNTAYARESLSRPKMFEDQITGSASSYARKYAWQGLLSLDDGKDSDTQKPLSEKDSLVMDLIANMNKLDAKSKNAFKEKHKLNGVKPSSLSIDELKDFLVLVNDSNS